MFLLIKKTMLKIVSVILATTLVIGTIGVAINKSKTNISADEAKNNTSFSCNSSKSQSNSEQISLAALGSIKTEGLNNINPIENDLENQKATLESIDHKAIESIIKNLNSPFDDEPLSCSSSLISKGSESQSNSEQTSLADLGPIKIEGLNNINLIENDLENQKTALESIDHKAIESIIKNLNSPFDDEPLSCSSSLISKGSESQSNSEQTSLADLGPIQTERLNNIKPIDLENQKIALESIYHKAIESIIKDSNSSFDEIEPLSHSSSPISKSSDEEISNRSIKSNHSLSDDDNSNKSVKLLYSLSDSDNSSYDNSSNSESLNDNQDLTQSIRLPFLSKCDNTKIPSDQCISVRLNTQFDNTKIPSDQCISVRSNTQFDNTNIPSDQCISVRSNTRFDNHQYIDAEHSSNSSSIDVSKKSQSEYESPSLSLSLSYTSTDEYSYDPPFIKFNTKKALNFIDNAIKLKTVSINNDILMRWYEPPINPLTEDMLQLFYKWNTSKCLSNAFSDRCISIEQFLFFEIYDRLVNAYNRQQINYNQFRSLSQKLPNDIINFLNNEIEYPAYCPGNVRRFFTDVTNFIYDSIESEIKTKI